MKSNRKTQPAMVGFGHKFTLGSVPLFICSAWVFIALLAGCSNPNFFPQTRPLFIGLSEDNISIPARAPLAKAKEDFARAQKDQEPLHSRYTESVLHRDWGARTRIFRGEGYILAIVGSRSDSGAAFGPEIVLEPAITGGAPFSYSEVDVEIN